MKYRGSMIHLKINGKYVSANLYLGVNSTKRVANTIRELTKQCDPSEFIGWVTMGFSEDLPNKHKEA